MKLVYIKVDGYKNLNKFELNFEKPSSIAAIIGNNGSGKSNLLEAIAIIFSSIKVNEEVPFIFDIEYYEGDEKYRLSNENGKYCLNGEKITPSMHKYLPRSLFLYYCGETDRLKMIAEAKIDKSFEKSLKTDDEFVLKYNTYIGLKEFGPAMLAANAFENELFCKICGLLNIDGMTGRTVFKLKKPGWSKSAKVSDNSFWNARGTVDYLLNTIKRAGSLKILNNDSAEILVNDFSKIDFQAENAFDLFTKYELLIQAGILESIDFEVKKGDTLFGANDLSEGEKQLALILAIMDITKEYRALFLLDEFDAFLHPGWQRKFLQMLSSFEINGQVIFTTHSPLTLGKMEHENVRILKDGEVFKPTTSSYNRDVSEVLEEIMEVKKRPDEVTKLISIFRSNIAKKEIDTAKQAYEELTKYLTCDDPFILQAESSIARLERHKK